MENLIILYLLVGVACGYLFLLRQGRVYAGSLLMANFVVTIWPLYLLGMGLMLHLNRTK